MNINANQMRKISECYSDSSSPQSNNPKFFISSSIEENESEYDDINEENIILEESPNGRWNKLATKISVQKLPDFDTINLAIDTEKGLECAWNELHISELITKFNDFRNLNSNNENLNYLSEYLFDFVNLNLKCILIYLKKLDHLNILTFYDYWYVSNNEQSKWVVITELSSAGSLKRLLENSRKTKTPIKQKTYKRWLNQLLNAIRYIHMQDLSIFQGNINTETIFIQNNSAIKIAPTLLTLAFSMLINNETNNLNLINNNNSNISINDLLRLNDNIVNKDLNAIGRIAIEIFVAHLSLTAYFNGLNNTSGHSSNGHNQNLMKLIELFNSKEELEKFDLIDSRQKEFIYNCLNPNEMLVDNYTSDANSYKLKCKLLSYQPLINEIYSLKVLSVHSVLVFFQEKHFKSYSNPHLLSRKNSVVDEIDNADTENEKNNNESFFLNPNLHCQNFLKPPKPEKEFISHRKVSLNSLTNVLNFPKDFFTILEDIKLGCYPRLHSKSETPNITVASLNIFKDMPTTALNIPLKTTENDSTSSQCKSRVQTPNNEELHNRMMKFNRNISNPSTTSSISVDDITSPKEHRTITNDDFMFEFNDEQCSNTNSLDYSSGENVHVQQPETRRVKHNNCVLFKFDNNSNVTDVYQLILKIKFDDNLNRILECIVPNEIFHNSDKINTDENWIAKISDVCLQLTTELVDYGLICIKDKEIIINTMKRTLMSYV